MIFFCVGDNIIVFYSFMDGKPVNKTLINGKVDLNVITQIAKTVRKMHDMGMNDNQFNLPNLPFENVNIRKTNLHFDLTKSNIFIDQEGGISIIDFDDAMYGSAIYDIAILISTFFFSKSRGIDLEGMNTFLDAYYGEDDSIKKEETLLIKKCAIQWIDFLLSNHKLPESLIDSFQTKKRLIEDNL